VKRAKTITGLLWQTISLRWNGISGRGKTLVLVGLVLAGAVALHLGTCFLGGCPGAASPCSSPCSASEASEEPCSLSAAPEAEAASELTANAEATEVPPCHAR